MGKSVDEVGLKKTMELLIDHSDREDDALRELFDEKISSVQGAVQSISQDMINLTNSVDERVEQMHQEVSGYTNILNTISQQITDLSNGLNAKIDSIKQDFDNLDTQVNNMNTKLNELSDAVDAMNTEDATMKDTIATMSSDIGTIKDAMDNMIVNIIPNDNGQFDVYHYNGTVNHNTIVNEIDPTGIDDLLLGFDFSTDNETDSEEEN